MSQTATVPTKGSATGSAEQASSTIHPALHAPMSHRQILEALSGLLLAMFVAILSSTVVSNALPVIVSDLGGSESGYTWVVTATLLATTISTPIWGKLSDLFSKKALVQIAILIFVAASAVAGLSENMTMLITMRVFQGIGAGGLTALAQVVMATMIAPRERGRYSGYLGATFALATVSGPLLGGAITEHLSWHWCFYVGVPFAVAAFVVLQKTLHLPVIKRKAQIDYLGTVLLSAGVSSLLVWVSLAGQRFDWWSWQTWLMVGGGIALLLLTLLAEHQAPEPIIPLRFFRNPTVVLSSLASMFVGVAMFGATIFLSQYFQLSRGESPTMSGLLTLPMVAGLAISSTIIGQLITRTGRWKVFVVGGGVALTAGLGLMGTVAWDTDYWIVAIYMFLVGAGVGAMMQNLVLAVQNIVAPQDLGAASSFVAFTRSLGGAIGVSALGAVLAHRVVDHLKDGFTSAGVNPGASLGTSIPDLTSLPEPIRVIVQAAYGDGIADLFLVAAPFALIALIISAFLKESKLATSRPGAPATGSMPAGESEGPNEADVDDEPQDDQRWNSPEDHHSTTRVDTSELALVGTVTHHDRPLAGAQVTLADQSGNQIAHTTTAVDGHYLIPLARAGSYLLIVGADRLSPAASLVSITDGLLKRDITLTGRSAITGRVLHQAIGADAPTGVARATVTLLDEGGQVVGSTQTRADGGYSFDHLTPGSYVLTAQAAGHRPVARTLQVPDSGALAFDLSLVSGGRLTGSVLAASDGKPVREATIALVDTTGRIVARTATGADGHYQLDDLPAGSYTLAAAGYAPVAHQVDIEDEVVTTVQVTLGEADALPQPTRKDVIATRVEG